MTMIKLSTWALIGIFLFLWQLPSALSQYVLNANLQDPFPANAEALVDRAKTNEGIAQAINSFRAGNAEAIKANLEVAREKNSNLPAVDIMLARMLMANGQLSEALSVLESYVTTNSSNAEVYKSFAEIAMMSGRWTDAWLQLEKCYSLVDSMKFHESRKSDFVAELVKLRGDVAEQRNDLATATKLFELLAKLNPKSGDSFWALGRLKVRANEVEAGFELLMKARLLDSKLPQPELAIAIELLGRGDREKAERWFRNGLTNKSTATEDNRLQYVQFLIDDKRAAEAQGILAEAPAEYLSKRDCRLLKAIIHRYLNENAEAEKLLSELHQENPNDFDAADHLALVLIESSDEGKRARAQQISEANFRQSPKQERLAATAAWIKYKTGSADVAEKILAQVISGGRISAQTAYYLGTILTSMGKSQEGRQFLKVAADSPGNFPQKKFAQLELDRAN